MKWDSIALEELAVQRGGSVDPKKYKEEIFELFSVPAFDAGLPEILQGADIGSSKKCVQPNDVLISRIVPHIRRAWVVGSKNGYRQIASSEWIIFRGEKIWPQYLRWVLMSDEFHSDFMRTVSGVGGSLLRARPAEVYKIKILLPPIDEQKRIAAVLDAADALRAKRRESLDQLDVLLQSTFLDMFGDPVENPKCWDAIPLSMLATAERGRFSPRPRNDPSYYNGSFPFIQTGDIANSNGYISTWRQTLNDKGITISKRFEPGTIVIAIVGATIGKTAILSIPAYCPDSVVGIIPKKDVAEAIYLEFALSLRRSELLKRAPHTARANINLEILRPFLILSPPYELQRRFATIAQSIETQKTRLRAHLAELDTLFASLQSRAFNGEL